MLKFPLPIARLILPTSFEECLTYGQRQEFMWRKIKELEEKVEELTPDETTD